MLISLHLPKTAGTSFRQTLESVYGSKLFSDYYDMSSIQDYLLGEVDANNLTKPDSNRVLVGVDCIHGHFLPAKYRQMEINGREKLFITWLREPFSRMVSHYYFFKRTYDPRYAGKLFRKVIEEGWSLEQFCLSNEFRNIYIKYLCGFNLTDFAFVGITEYYQEDMMYFSRRFIDVDAKIYHTNEGRANQAEEALSDVALRRKVEAFHAKDFDLYYRAVEARNCRINTL